jgi:hypothetical protein
MSSGLSPSILRHSGILGAAEKWSDVEWKYMKNPGKKIAIKKYTYDSNLPSDQNAYQGIEQEKIKRTTHPCLLSVRDIYSSID